MGNGADEAIDIGFTIIEVRGNAHIVAPRRDHDALSAKLLNGYLVRQIGKFEAGDRTALARTHRRNRMNSQGRKPVHQPVDQREIVLQNLLDTHRFEIVDALGQGARAAIGHGREFEAPRVLVIDAAIRPQIIDCRIRAPAGDPRIENGLPTGCEIEQADAERSAEPFVGGRHQRVDLRLAEIDRHRADRLRRIDQQEGADGLGRFGDPRQVEALARGIFHMADRHHRGPFIDGRDQRLFVDDAVFRADIVHFRPGMPRDARPRIGGGGKDDVRRDDFCACARHDRPSDGGDHLGRGGSHGGVGRGASHKGCERSAKLVKDRVLGDFIEIERAVIGDVALPLLEIARG